MKRDYHGEASDTVEVSLEYGLVLVAEYSLKYTVSPYNRGDYWNPPEGGGIEEIEWTQTSMTIIDSEGDEIAFSLNENERKRLKEKADEIVEKRMHETCMYDFETNRE